MAAKEPPHEREKARKYQKLKYMRQKHNALSESQKARRTEYIPVTVKLPSPIVATLEEYALRGIPSLTFNQLVEQAVLEMIRTHRGLSQVFRDCSQDHLTRFGENTGINISELADKAEAREEKPDEN